MGVSHEVSGEAGVRPASGGDESPGGDAVVRPLSRAAGRPCSRPGCPAPAQATLTFRYDSREASLGELSADPTPAGYDLCATHADRTGPPRGWELVDARPDEADGSEAGDDTVAVLAAALRPDDAAPTDGDPSVPRPVLAQRGGEDAAEPTPAPGDPAPGADEHEPAGDDPAAPDTASDGGPAEGGEPGDRPAPTPDRPAPPEAGDDRLPEEAARSW